MLKNLKKQAGWACCGIFVTFVLVPAVAVFIAFLTGKEERSRVVNKLTTSNMLNNSIYSDNRLYSDVCWLTSHNSFAHPIPDESETDAMLNNHVGIYQFFTIKEQLEFGVRSFMIELHYKDKTEKEVVIAHEKAHFFEQSLLDFLTTIKQWLNSNRDDIITIHLKSYIGSHDNVMDVIKKSGLKKFLFDLTSFGGQWPTLGQMRNQNKRLIIFSDKQADTIDKNGRHISGIMHTTSYMETEFNLAKSPNCEMRIDNRATTADLLVMNHFYPVTIISGSTGIIGINDRLFPFSQLLDKSDHDEHIKLIRTRVCKCLIRTTSWPNFVAIDFIGTYDGEELSIVADINTRKILLRKLNTKY